MEVVPKKRGRPVLAAQVAYLPPIALPLDLHLAVKTTAISRRQSIADFVRQALTDRLNTIGKEESNSDQMSRIEEKIDILLNIKSVNESSTLPRMPFPIRPME
jgi:hypothetical protein